MPEPEETAVLTVPADQPEAQTPAVEPPATAPPFTRQEAETLINSIKEELLANTKKELDAAYKTARRSESKADAANPRIAKLETRMEDLATRGMDENEAKLWKAERALERVQDQSTTVSAERVHEENVASFRERSTSYLSSEGIRPEDPRLTAAFAKYSADAKTPDDWDKALYKSVVDIHKDERNKTAAEVKVSIDRAREEERAKLRNEQRQSDGPVDKGQPSSKVKSDWLHMSDEEFKRLEAEKDAERQRRSRNF